MSRDYDSNFDTESECEERGKSGVGGERGTTKRKEQNVNEWQTLTKKRKPLRNEFIEESDKYERKLRTNLQSLDAYSRHKLLVNEYILSYSGSTAKLVRDKSKDKTEYEVLRDNHRFIWDESEEGLSWGQRLAKNYYNKLFKEYCISDLSRYKENKFGMRWRTEKEVIEGRGQFSCGAKHCENREGLKSWEVLFAYEELGQKKSALVKLRLCVDCSVKLNYRHKRKEIKKMKKYDKRGRRERNSRSDTSADESTVSTSNELEDNRSETKGHSDKGHSSSDVNEIWTKPQPIPDLDKPIDDEFDEYLEDLLL